jgi:hypothetical protein
LGWEMGGFHSYLCHSLEVECCNELGLNINKYGRFDSYEDCEKTTKYLCLESTGAEPVFWQSWCVHEYDIDV